MKTIKIVYETEKIDGNIVPSVYQIINTSDKFQGDVTGLIEAVSNSNLTLGIKNYKYYIEL